MFLTVVVATSQSSVTTRIQMRAAASAAASMTRRTRIQTTPAAIFRPQHPRQRTLSSSSSSMGNIMSTPIPTPAPIVHMSMKPPRIVSRRAWQQQQQQQQQQQRHGGGGDAAGKKDQAKTAAAAAAAAAAEKPWPASVRYTAYVTAVTVIPYMMAWMISYNPTLRSLVLKEPVVVDENNNNKKSNNKKNTLEDYLRWQFGTPDEEESQTTTTARYQEDDDDDDAVLLIIPKQFPNEWPYSIRAAQAAIRALEKQNISVRIGILTDDGSSNIENNTQQQPQAAATATTDGMSGPYTASLGDMRADDDAAYYYHLLPGSTPARIDAIIKAMKKTAATTTSDNIASRNRPFPPPFLSSLSLDFEDVPQTKTTNDAMTTTTTAEMNDDDNDKEMQESSTLTTTKKPQKQKHTDPLLKQISCFSLWHYQDAAILQAQVQQRKQQQQQNTASNSKNHHHHHNHNSIELARLEFQVQQYQDELNNAASSLRAVDDIRQDLQESKAALKRLQRIGNNNKSWWSW